MKGVLKDLLKKGDSKLTASNLLDQMSVFIAGWISLPHFTVKGGRERGELQVGIFFHVCCRKI